VTAFKEAILRFGKGFITACAGGRCNGYFAGASYVGGWVKIATPRNHLLEDRFGAFAAVNNADKAPPRS
jgi:hypothetical protein